MLNCTYKDIVITAIHFNYLNISGILYAIHYRIDKINEKLKSTHKIFF